MAIHLSKQDPKNFGFKNMKPHATVVFNTSYLGFADEKERSEALAKWNEFRAKQNSPDPKKPEEAKQDESK